MTESIVQKKSAQLILEELGPLLRKHTDTHRGVLLTVSKVWVAADYSIARINMSVFPDARMQEMILLLNEQSWELRRDLAQRIRNKLRKMPELRFYPDESYRYADEMDQILRDLRDRGQLGTDEEASPETPQP
ncbi:MAG: ribosome-binding factor A [Bacteroidia bacterium]|nr:ribosome-binding factor A [Bacteroidia bacterium]